MLIALGKRVVFSFYESFDKPNLFHEQRGSLDPVVSRRMSQTFWSGCSRNRSGFTGLLSGRIDGCFLFFKTRLLLLILVGSSGSAITIQ